MNWRTILASSAVLGLLAAGDAAAQKLSLRIDQGLVTLEAENVTIDEILARWTDLTGLNVVSKNGEGSDIPVTLRFAAVPEREAMATLLRGLSGYIMGERRDPRTGIVMVDRLMILPQSAAQASSLPPRPVPAPPRPSVEIGTQQIALPESDDVVEEANESDDTPRELAPGPTFAGTAGAPLTLGGAVNAAEAPVAFAIAPVGVVSDDNPAGLNSPTLAPGQVVAPQVPPTPPAPVPTKENPFAAAGAAQPGVIVAPRSPTPPAAESPTPSLRVLPAPPAPPQ